MPSLIGLTGAAGSGKSVAADALAEEGYVRVRVSTPLKNMLRAYYHSFGISPEEIERKIEGDLKETPCPLLFGKTPRYAMQTIGTEWGRALISERIWADGWKIRATVAMQAGHDVVAEDIRFTDEEAALRELDGTVVQLTGRAKEDVVSGKHRSEDMEGIKPDVTVKNDGSIEDLKSKIALVSQMTKVQSAA